MGVANPFRHQIPSTSPISGGGLLAGARAMAAGAGTRDRLGRRLEELLGREHAVAGVTLTGSGTEALVLALEVGERLVGRTAAVVLPAFSCFDVAAAAARFGRTIRFYDVSPRTLGPEPESLREAIEGGVDGARIVLVASLFGIPLDWNLLDPLLDGPDVVVVEDAAQGHGARWRGARLGGHGRLGILSFSRGKGWTGGAGGALLVRDKADLAAVEWGSANSRKADAGVLARAAMHWLLGRPLVYGLPRAFPPLGLGETRYREARAPGPMPAAAAALALATRDAADAVIAIRRSHALEYENAFLRDPGVGRVVVVPEAGEAGYGRYPLLLPEGMASFSNPEAARELGAEASYPAALPDLPAIRGLIESTGETRPGRWPGARALASQLVTLPTHAMTRASERRRLVELLDPAPREPA